MRVLSAPSAITGNVIRFCSSISPEQPVYVPVKPAPGAKPSFCFDNVAMQIKQRGGSVVYGWAIWHWPGMYFEAEHHGVCRNRAGKLLDVSPAVDGGDAILFLPDPTAIYTTGAFRSTSTNQMERTRWP